MEKRRERQRVGSRGASEVSEQEERTEGVERGDAREIVDDVANGAGPHGGRSHPVYAPRRGHLTGCLVIPTAIVPHGWTLIHF